MSTRKRIKSVTVDEILSEIKQMTKNDSSIYKKLSTYDQVLKKYKIDSLNEIALEIYEYLIEQQTVSTLPERSRIKINPLKFSRSQIQIFQDQSNKNNQNIQDPEIYNDKLFSFAKNNRHDIKRHLNDEDQLEPRQLFMEPNKFKSDSKPKKYSNRLERQELIENLQNKSLKKSKSKSAKDLSKSANTESQKNIISKSVIFNSEKSKQIEKAQQINEQKLLEQYLKKQYFLQFFLMIKRNRQQDHYEAIYKKVKYIYCIKLFDKSFESLKKNCFLQKQANQKAQKFRSIRDQSLVEQVFIQWNMLANLNEQRKQRIQQISNNFSKLCSYLFVNRLKSTAHKIRLQKQEKLKLKNQLQNRSQILLKKILYQVISSKFQFKKCIQQKLKNIKKYQVKKGQNEFIRKIQKYCQVQKQKQNQKVNKCIIKVYGNRFLKNLNNEQNFMEVYWKRKEQSKKIIFLNYLLTALKLSYERLGYSYYWMKTLETNIKNTDSKLGNVLSRYKKFQVFKRLIAFHKQQKKKRHQIKIMLMDDFLKRLAYSNYINFKKQSEEVKKNQLLEFLFVKKGSELLKRLKKTQEKQFQQKQANLKTFLFQSKSGEFFIYLESYKRTKEHYLKILTQYSYKRKFNLLSSIWKGFKNILKEQIINKKLAAQYLKLKDKITLQKCFDGLKNNIFEEKLFRKKQQNINKLIKRKNFDQLLNKLGQNLKYQPIRKKQIQFEFLKSFMNKRKSIFFQVFKTSLKQSILRKCIQQRLVRNNQTHQMEKCFQIMKFIAVKTKQQRQVFEHIKGTNQIKIKVMVFEKLLQITLKRQSIKQLINIIKRTEQRSLQRVQHAFILLKGKNKLKLEICQE